MDKVLHEENLLGQKGINLDLDIGAIEGLKKMPVDMFDGAYLDKSYDEALILCVDLRNFSDFLCMQDDDLVFKLITDFTSNLLSCINQFGCNCSYYKFLGDGVLIIWDEINRVAISEALQVFYSYTEFLNEELLKPFETLSLGGALVKEKVFKYEISAEISQLKYRDYVGYGVNLACRLQNLAKDDKLILNEKLAATGILPFTVDETPQMLKDLHALKGITEEDRKRVLFYDKNHSSAL